MQFEILGPLDVRIDGHRPALGGPQQRALLAVLLLNANRVVSTGRLIGWLWGESPPATARGLLQGCVAQLRRALLTTEDGALRQPLLTRPAGYLLDVRPGELDLERFEGHVSRAHRWIAEQSPEAVRRAAAALRDAAAVWRGPTLEDITLDVCRREAVRLDERRLAVEEERVELELALGRHRDVVGELWTGVREQPLRESRWALLMVALVGADRQAEALDAYRELRETLIDQLGIEPSATLGQVHQAILSGADALQVYRRAREGTDAPRPPTPAPPGAARPAQLPAAIAGFAGRSTELADLDRLSTVAMGEGTALVVISGTAGIGKTALALHWAHQAYDRFRDGQLYVNLRGFDPAPSMRPIEALTASLIALGVPAEQIPLDEVAAATIYRTTLAHRRVLVILDNAESAAQVRPLLPGGHSCFVLVTSRNRLGGLQAREGAHRLRLDVLDPAAARSLLTGMLGARRAGAEPDATAALARACGYLPLALRIAAANLADQARRTIASYVSELTAGDRIADLAIDDDPYTTVAAAFDVSYANLEAATRRLFRRLSLVPGPTIHSGAAAALVELAPSVTARLLDRLVGAHLLEQPGDERYAFHDLLREYAAACGAREDSEAERADAVRRLFDWYLRVTDAAARLLNPTMLRLPGGIGTEAVPFEPVLSDHAAAGAWLDSERANLVAAVRAAAEHGPRPAAWLLADALRGYFWVRGHTFDWLEVARCGLTAAQVEGDRQGQAAAELGLANAYLGLTQYAEAVEHSERAVGLAQDSGWSEGHAAALGNIGLAYWQLGRLADAAERYRQALAVNRRIGRLTGLAINLSNLGIVYRELGRLALAVEHSTEGLALFRQAASGGGDSAAARPSPYVAVNLANLGEAYWAMGQLDLATQCLTEAHAVYEQVGDQTGAGEAHRILADVHLDAGREAAARQHADAAWALVSDSEEVRFRADALGTLARIHHRVGDYATARDHYLEATALPKLAAGSHTAVAAQVGLGAAYYRLGQLDRAAASVRQALTAAVGAGYAVLEANALTVLAELQRGIPDADGAGRTARQAQEIYRTTGAASPPPWWLHR